MKSGPPPTAKSKAHRGSTSAPAWRCWTTGGEHGMKGTRERTKTFLIKYVTKIGNLQGVKYEIQFKDAE